MAITQRNLVEYHGISVCQYENLPNFNQVIKDFTFCVPTQKPDIEQVVKVWARPCIVQQKVIQTPRGTSIEGQHVTGYKLMIAGDINYKVEYVALEATQSMHTAHTVIPFCGYIVLPEKFNPNSIITANVLVEDIHTEQLDSRCVYNNITMMLTADLC
ncbi:MAG: DUF3794 domain-containing protein [Niameybacter sp.]|uniref:SPOCS domain-containing protein n=1 Tax=Niameybacter sp. TaxID=2033640 RepID=UPI002FCABF69